MFHPVNGRFVPASQRTFVLHALVALVGLGAGAAHAHAQDTGTPAAKLPGNKVVKARLALERTAIAPQGTTDLAIVFDISPDWHLYWRNPGDAGLPPKIAFTPIPGVTFGDPQWPAPQRDVAAGGLVSFVYPHQLVLIVPIATDLPATHTGPLEISARVDWLVCSKRCIPGRANLSASWPVSADAELSDDAGLFAETRKHLPQAASTDTCSCRINWEDHELLLHVDGATRLTFFPYENDANVYPDNILSGGQSDSAALRLQYGADVAKLAQVTGILVVTRGGSTTVCAINTPPPSAADSGGPAE